MPVLGNVSDPTTFAPPRIDVVNRFVLQQYFTRCGVAQARKNLYQLLTQRLLRKPLIPCSIKGKWIPPGLFCRVAFQERTESGDLRSPVFKELVVRDEADASHSPAITTIPSVGSQGKST